MHKKKYDIVTVVPGVDSLWNGAHKIPWNDPAFSARILKEHLSQDHHLASRKAQIIEAQIEWIQTHCLGNDPMTILDLGCGPGLYSMPLAGNAHSYCGIDFSPASIEYAKATYGTDRCEFTLGDVTQADYGGPHDMVMILYGELNVFSPADCRLILGKAHEALAPGGRLLVEFQNPTWVQGVGEAPNSWTRAADGGLFSDEAYVSLTENHWFAEEGVALQCFHVMEQGGEAKTYRSTTKAWSMDEVKDMLPQAGFGQITNHEDWPLPDNNLLLVSAVKA